MARDEMEKDMQERAAAISRLKKWTIYRNFGGSDFVIRFKPFFMKTCHYCLIVLSVIIE